LKGRCQEIYLISGLVNLSLAIITINDWNRLAMGFRKFPGEYQARKIG
jgi:hypothetical protein